MRRKGALSKIANGLLCAAIAIGSTLSVFGIPTQDFVCVNNSGLGAAPVRPSSRVTSASTSAISQPLEATFSCCCGFQIRPGSRCLACACGSAQCAEPKPPLQPTSACHHSDGSLTGPAPTLALMAGPAQCVQIKQATGAMILSPQLQAPVSPIIALIPETSHRWLGTPLRRHYRPIATGGHDPPTEGFAFLPPLRGPPCF